MSGLLRAGAVSAHPSTGAPGGQTRPYKAKLRLGKDCFFPATQIDVVWFPEGAGGDKFTEKIFRAPLSRMAREALDYIRRNYISETVIKHPDRAEVTRMANFPYAAIEEAVANAVYHRSYEEREPIEVRISADELVVLSYPGPDRSVRLEQLRAGRALPRRYRNRRIGEFLKELGMTEGRSTGIPKILHAMEQNGSPPPEFEFDEDHSYFMVRLLVHPQARSIESAQGTDEGALPKAQSESRLESALAAKVLRLLKNSEMGKAGMASGLGHKTVSGELHKQVKRLLGLDLIEMTIPDKPNSRLQRYRLTAKGRELLASLGGEGV